ncbi:MAG TPA: hypothetical protein VFN23_19885 [Ktedonobacteraceae bacterium]|nr:hypothetical protein [Ktedonobacteraceae bacterium]
MQETAPTVGNAFTKYYKFLPSLYPQKRVMTISLSIMTLLLALLYAPGSVSASNVRTEVLRSVAANNAVLSNKNDLARTGEFSNETTLTTSNVNSTQFGKRVSYPVDGQVYAEPLYVPNLTINGVVHNVVIVATENDSIYAFDADQTSPGAPLWRKSFLKSGVTVVSSTAVSCTDIKPQYGITSTPVIDSGSNTMYLVANTMENGVNTYRLHAVDITTGLDRAGSPTIIKASSPGSGAGSVKGVITFNPIVEGQRGGLLLINGHVYIDFASHCDNGAYHGWIMSYNTSNLQQTGVYNSTREGNQGGIWEAGEGITSDGGNNIYVMTGNGNFNKNTGGNSLGDSFIKLNISNGGFKVVDYFTPFNQACLDAADKDLGSSGTILLPGGELLGSGKEGRIYVLNQSNLGGYHTITNPCSNLSRTNVDQIVQEAGPNTAKGGIWGTPAFWNGGSNGQYVYTGGVGDHLRAFTFSNGKISLPSSSMSPESFGFPGANPVISSNGTMPGTGIVWALGNGGVLYAYDATDLSKELYTSKQNAARDSLGSYTKFSVPTIANGEVFAGTQDHLVIYGILGPSGPATYNNIGVSNDSNPTSANFDGGGRSYSQQALSGAGLNQGSPFSFNGVTFTWPNVPSGSADNYVAQGQTINFTSNSGNTKLAFLGSSNNGPFTATATITYSDNTTASFTLSFSDWTLNGGKSAILAADLNAATMSYRNSPTGKQATPTHLFYTDTNIDSTKIVKSITLPNTGHLHIFAIGSK